MNNKSSEAESGDVSHPPDGVPSLVDEGTILIGSTAGRLGADFTDERTDSAPEPGGGSLWVKRSKKQRDLTDQTHLLAAQGPATACRGQQRGH